MVMARDLGPAAIHLARELALRDPGAAAEELDSMAASEVSDVLGDLSSDARRACLQAVNPALAGQVLLRADAADREAWSALMSPTRLALCIGQLEAGDAEAVLADVPPALARSVAEITTFPTGTAGSIMDPRVTHFRARTAAADALATLRGLGHLRVTSLHITDENDRFVGSVRLQDVALADPSAEIGGLIGGDSPRVQTMAQRTEVVELMETHNALTLPVVDFDGLLVGVIRHEALMEAVESEALADLQTMVGASREERALSPISFAVRKRLPWLQVNLLTAFLASFVVGLFEDTIARFTALAVLLPVVAGQSGNTGAQALAVTMRGLALREIRIGDHGFRVLMKEAVVGAANGVAVAVVTSTAVYLWSRSVGIAAVIGVAMVGSMIIAGFSGAIIPMILTRLGQDPAQSSSIILTTVTDVAGFLSFLGLATLFASTL
jgi:magnesium transporter